MAEKKPFYYGGQAVIEGVMIRGRSAVVTAVRRPSGQIGTDVKPLSSIYTGRMRRFPLVRGVIVLIEAMVLGVKSLLFSANVAVEEEDISLVPYALLYRAFFALTIDVAKLFASLEQVFKLRMDWGKLERMGRI